jgi:1,4-dihydroxy-2-naphthoate octaprenyltransferase
MVTAFQLMTHFANDFFDRAGDRHGQPTDFAGGSGVLVRGELPPSAALGAAFGCAALGALAIAGIAHAGLWIVAGIGAAMGACSWCYSAPPLRLAGRGWGELDTALVVGVLVPLAGYSIFTGGVDALAVAATAAPALAMFVMMIAVEWPDREADAAADKRNLIIRLGSGSAARLAAAGALLIVPALFLAIGCGAPRAGTAFALLLVPVIALFVRRFNAAAAPALELAARGVTVFLLTVVYELLGYATLPR